MEIKKMWLVAFIFNQLALPEKWTLRIYSCVHWLIHLRICQQRLFDRQWPLLNLETRFCSQKMTLWQVGSQALGTYLKLGSVRVFWLEGRNFAKDHPPLCSIPLRTTLESPELQDWKRLQSLFCGSLESLVVPHVLNKPAPGSRRTERTPILIWSRGICWEVILYTVSTIGLFRSWVKSRSTTCSRGFVVVCQSIEGAES